MPGDQLSMMLLPTSATATPSWSRSSTGSAGQVKNLKETVDDLQARGIGLRALSQGIDTTTPGGRLFFHMLAAIAEFEHDLIVERT